ncbi:MAG: hypothetical protein QNJ07_05080 [Woeseiaceae bacterium]|nr:hypothetical protein [Woeseiaceae bacterium]
MRTRHQCPREIRTARFNVPVRHRSTVRRLLDQLIAPAMRLHQYRNLSTGILENALDKMESRRCE